MRMNKALKSFISTALLVGIGVLSMPRITANDHAMIIPKVMRAQKAQQHPQLERICMMEATAYCTGEVTRSGTRVHYGVVASDPRVIPLGSIISVEDMTTFENMGTFSVEDTGGKIKGDQLDIYVPGYKRCIRFGRRKIKVTVLRKGGSKK
jgi:3D (Asp-Asp-Asp) domain-containing protein